MKKILVLMSAAVLVGGCKYQPILERPREYVEAQIPVKVNWDTSGFDVTDTGKSKQSTEIEILKTTFRFFPKDGSSPFERYIGDGHSITEGYIEVPKGEYSVIVMNDQINDARWEGTESGGVQTLAFENVDSYDDFAAFVHISDQVSSGYYWPENLYRYISLPMRISTYSIDNFVVTDSMVNYRPDLGKGSLSEQEMEYYLSLSRQFPSDTNGLDMRKLCYDVDVELRIQNLSSVALDGLKGGVIGFANKVNMRSGLGFIEPALGAHTLQYFTFSQRGKWVDPQGRELPDGWQPAAGDNTYRDYSGSAYANYLTLGRNLVSGYEQYGVQLDFMYIDGTLRDRSLPLKMYRDTPVEGAPTSPTDEFEYVTLPIDVTEQIVDGKQGVITKQTSAVVEIDIDLYLATFEVPYTSGDIEVTEWEDDEVIPIH